MYVCVSSFSLTQLGCDGRLNSGVKTDRCGMCGGDGSSCKLNSGTVDFQIDASKGERCRPSQLNTTRLATDTNIHRNAYAKNRNFQPSVDHLLPDHIFLSNLLKESSI